jgi:hypothetical protein
MIDELKACILNGGDVRDRFREMRDKALAEMSILSLWKGVSAG